MAGPVRRGPARPGGCAGWPGMPYWPADREVRGAWTPGEWPPPAVPGGRQHGYSAGVRSPAGWIRSRLAGWLGPDEVPLPSRSQRLAEARHQVLAEQAARRARDEAARAQAADYPAQAARAREMLMRRSRLAARAVASPQAD